MTRPDYPITQAIRMLREKKIAFTPHLYPFEEHGGTRHVSEYFLIPEHQVIKTLIMEPDDKKPLIVLMHGDCEVSVKQLARELGVKRVSPCEENDAQRFTGYLVGASVPSEHVPDYPFMLNPPYSRWIVSSLTAGRGASWWR